MTIEEKAKAYNEAKEKMREIITMDDNPVRPTEIAKYLFPELAESEDEKIRKEIIHHILHKANGVSEEQEHSWVAYLEKQKVNTDGDFARGYDCGYECCLNSHGAEWFEKKKEQKPKQSETEKEYVRTLHSLISDFLQGKRDIDIEYYQKIWDWLDNRHIEQEPPDDTSFEDWIDGWYHEHCSPANNAIQMTEKAFKNWSRGIKNMYEQNPAKWSEDDASNLQSCIAKIELDMRQWEGHGKTMVDGDIKLIDWLKSLPERFELQPKREWSEEDKRMLNTTLSFFPILKGLAEGNMILGREGDQVKVIDECCAWLKSLHPQSHWKPSEMQLEALLNAEGLVRANNYPENAKILASLYEQLKKL